MNKIGIMCGRLSKSIENQIQAFPSSSWKEEFPKAEKIGYELIEWIVETNEKNPIIWLH